VLGIIGAIANVDPKVVSFDPTELLKLLPECRDLQMRIRIGLGVPHHHTDAPRSLPLLCAYPDGPSDRRAAEE